MILEYDIFVKSTKLIQDINSSEMMVFCKFRGVYV